jgi:hypothetical protein
MNKNKGIITVMIFGVLATTLIVWHAHTMNSGIRTEMADSSEQISEQIKTSTEKLLANQMFVTDFTTEKIEKDKDASIPSMKIHRVPFTDIWYVEEGAVLIPVEVDGKKIEPGFKFHQILFDKNIGHPIGILGAISYILDSSGRKISEGFHTFFKKDSQIWGRLGAKEEKVVLVNVN